MKCSFMPFFNISVHSTFVKVTVLLRIFLSHTTDFAANSKSRVDIDVCKKIWYSKVIRIPSTKTTVLLLMIHLSVIAVILLIV